MSSLVGRSLGRYQIVAPLGAGGMGEVFRARDAQLSREVAIKVLPSGLADDGPAFERFQREARVIARLSHPNILEIYDFGREDGVTYAVTELLEGHDLRQRLKSQKKLEIPKAIDVAVAVAEGLGAAHGAGVVHRDIKPANIFITSGGRVKILDFGLARAPSEADSGEQISTASGPLTAPGAVLGTVGYMSPEQVRGYRVDARADIFAVGCVLYEMLSGHHPFRRDTTMDTMSAILSEDPPPISSLEPSLPFTLDQVLDRCLKKDPAERFESARDLGFALKALGDARLPSGRRLSSRAVERAGGRRARNLFLAAALIGAAALGMWSWWTPRSVMPQHKHTAVVSFTARSGEPASQQLAVGLAEDIADDLATLEEEGAGDFWVVPRRLMASPELDSVSRMHRDYNVTLGVEGTLETEKEVVRFVLTVVDAASGRRLREARIEDDFSNLSSFQIEPITRLAAMLGLELRDHVKARIEQASTGLPTAFVPYLRGRGLLRLRADAQDLESAIDLLREAVEEDPSFSRAHAALAEAYLQKSVATGDPEWSDRGLEVAQDLAARDPSARAFRTLAAQHEARGELTEAVSALEEAARSSPQSGETQLLLGRAYQAAGMFDEARRAFQRSINSRPGFWRGHYWLGALYLATGDYDGTANQFRQVIQCAPGYPRGYSNLGGVLHTLGRVVQAREMYERSIEMEPVDNYSALSNLGTLHFEAGRYADAAAMFERALERNDTHRVMWGNLGWAYAFSAAPERALAPFRRAIELGEAELVRRPENPDLLSELAAYYLMVEDGERALERQEAAIALDPTDPEILAALGENFEGMGRREDALEWVEKAIRAGYPPHRFEKPTLAGLVSDARFQEMAERARGVAGRGDRGTVGS